MSTMTGARKLKRIQSRKKERGIALIMVLGAIAVLTVLLAEFQEDTSAELASALADRDSVQAEYMARSAVNLSRLLIATEPTIRQAITPLFAFLKKAPPQLPVWEFSDRLLGAFNDQEAAKDFAGTVGVDLNLGKNLGMPGGRFELVIVDEDSKIDANLGASNDIAHIRLAKELMGLMIAPQYNPLFEQRDGTGQFHDRMQICQALIDWSDVDELAFSCDLSQNAPAGTTVEDASYQLLNKPYRRKNSPYDSLEELHMVNGIGDDFWSTFVDPEPTNPKKRVMTVWGQGSVNVNTATAQTLLAVVCSGAVDATDICIDPTQSSMFLMGVTMARGISMGAPLFGNANDFIQTVKGQGQLGPLLASMGMKPVKFKSEAEFSKSITTESKMFSVYAVGVVKGYKRETRLSIHAVVDFRAAPSLLGAGSGVPGTFGAPAASGSAAPAGSAPAIPGLPPGTDPNAIASALAPNTGGVIVYYQIE